ncbi:hypothetical protein ANCCEY_02359 [Ancylostoma ceylanicum]|uniref:DUF7758 domain-containing protein n=1 Tax=Ancylostoma ceylanicum TaxID=53326 RepID=A0A0D6M4V4_9BILA|nr:hypothetical protein ANCCEY_02359 [Ancylostoma ceylanicum]
MMLKSSYFHKRWRKVKSELLSVWLLKYKMCLSRLKKYLTFKDVAESQRRKSHAKLHPLPDRPIRRAASKLIRKPTNEIERLRRKGDNWTANDLFRFQYSDPEEGTTEERRELCYAWLERLQAISKKFCYLAWYEAAIYACYYRLAPIIVETEEKRKIWTDVKREYAQIFLMGRRIWRRPSHPSRLRVLYDMAMLCVRFGNVEVIRGAIAFKEIGRGAIAFKEIGRGAIAFEEIGHGAIALKEIGRGAVAFAEVGRCGRAGGSASFQQRGGVGRSQAGRAGNRYSGQIRERSDAELLGGR